MTRTYAARQLLALGPLSFREFMEITGWPFKTCRRVLSYLVDTTGEANRLGRLYKLETAGVVSDVRKLETERSPAYGKAPHGPVRAGSAVGIPAAKAVVRAVQAGCGRCGRCACGVGERGVK